jgi:hypothetical protein
MPIGAQWNCRSSRANRYASFWFEGERISRIGWGERPVVKKPPVQR